MQTLAVDQLVGNRLGYYHVERLLGQGRLNAVYLAHHPDYNSSVALTTFLIPTQLSPEAHTRFLQRFSAEAAVLTSLDHPHIMPVYDYGEQFGYPYLVTPYMMHGSLADVLKQRERCSISYTLELLEEVAAGLEYTHSQGVVHGMLKPSNIIFDSENKALVAGFGLMRILQLRGVERNEQPYAHLLNVAGTFLAAPEYIAPEVVQGQAVNACSDIYSLGSILFEMLSGRTLFSGDSALDIAMQHTQQPLPSLHSLAPHIPIALESVVNHALARVPAQRFQSADDLVEAFAQVCSGVAQSAMEPIVPESAKPSALTHTGEMQDTLQDGSTSAQASGKLRFTGTSSLLAKRHASPTTGPWQIVPPIVTGSLPTVQLSEVTNTARETRSPEPYIAAQKAPTEVMHPIAAQPSAMLPESSVASAQATNRVEASQKAADAPTEEVSTHENPALSAFTQPSNARRRHVIALLLASGGFVAASAFLVTKTNFFHIMNAGKTQANTSAKKRAMPAPTNKTTSNSSATRAGTIIGSTTVAVNSSAAFHNPVDGKASLLIHLPDHNFVAYERACTHEGVTVNYDPATHMLVCPAHGAIFNPADGAKVVQGPAQRPLVQVTVHINADGTITTT
ncbi:MAG: protein kinase [Ktedonobacteraceae bacterium]|nr:protein kinase [Ktedonobacteraceae bacterium]